MKAKIIVILAVVTALGVGQVEAATWWDSGHHVINDGDVYGEVFLENDASVDVLGGSILKLELFNFSTGDIFGGEMDSLWTNDYTVASIHGGTLDELACFPESSVYLYAYDVTFHPPDGTHNDQWLEGKYLNDGTPFSFEFYHDDCIPQLHIVPEPSTLLLLSLGVLILRKRD